MRARSSNAHKCDGEPELAIADGQNSERKCKVKVELGAYLTVHWHRDIHPDNAKYCADKTKDAREGINLSSE